MASRDAEAERFSRSFTRWARRVRWRLLTRRVMTGMAFGLTAGGGLAALLWWLRQGELRPWAAALGLAGGLLGFLVGVRRRWSDIDVALYLDAKLASEESISTAVELRSNGHASEEAREAVVRRAKAALANGNPKAARPRLFDVWQGLAPIGLAAVIWLSLAPLPPAAPPPPPPPGSELTKVADLRGLEKIIALEKLDARDSEQRKRLQKIADEAKRLREDLAKGISKREALSRIAKLRDDIAAERLDFADQNNRPGLEAAVRKLNENAKLKGAAKALGNGDLTEFDNEMQRLANRAEKQDREAAKRALEEAAKAAREKGARALAESLEDQRRLFEEREAGAEALRQLAEGLEGKLSEEALRDLEEFGESGSPEAQKRLAEALEDALSELSEEERKRLSEQLQRQLQENEGEVDPMTKEQIEELARKLQTPEGKKQLAEALKELARPKPSPDAQRQQGLDDAERGGGQCQRQLGGAVPLPLPGQSGSGKSGGKKQADQSGPDQDDKPPGGKGGTKDSGQGEHDGKTDPVDGKGLRAKARARLDPSAPMKGTSLGRAPARAGETANQQGSGALGRVGPDEVSGVQRSEVPEEYRKQVGRYFEP